MTKKDISDLIREEGKSLSAKGDVNEENTAAKSPSRSRRRTTPDRSTEKIKALTSALETAERNNVSLQEQIAALELELQTQKDLVETLQNKLQYATELEKELEAQKQLVAKLYSKLEKVEIARSQLEEQSESVPNPLEELQLANNKTSKIFYRPIARFVASSQPPTILSNEDIGWFD